MSYITYHRLEKGIPGLKIAVLNKGLISEPYLGELAKYGIVRLCDEPSDGTKLEKQDRLKV